jgi:hypothetical protein
MSPENTQKLYDTFPQLYRGRVKSIQESSMSWGFTCGDGWFDLVWTLSQKIEDAATAAGLEPQSDDWPEAIQVKQKIGTLRFYLKRSPLTISEEVCTLIRESEIRSSKTCEECGNPGSLLSGRGIQTLCKKHAKEFKLVSKGDYGDCQGIRINVA